MSTSSPVPARGARRRTVTLALAFIFVAKASSLQRAQRAGWGSQRRFAGTGACSPCRSARRCSPVPCSWLYPGPQILAPAQQQDTPVYSMYAAAPCLSCGLPALQQHKAVHAQLVCITRQALALRLQIDTPQGLCMILCPRTTRSPGRAAPELLTACSACTAPPERRAHEPGRKKGSNASRSERHFSSLHGSGPLLGCCMPSSALFELLPGGQAALTGGHAHQSRVCGPQQHKGVHPYKLLRRPCVLAAGCPGTAALTDGAR